MRFKVNDCNIVDIGIVHNDSGNISVEKIE
jgi:hypothetical protein